MKDLVALIDSQDAHKSGAKPQQKSPAERFIS
jgi:hypothetical protein